MKKIGVDVMELMSTNLKENVIDSYAIKPNLFYDVEGILVEKDGKNVKIEKNIDHMKVTYSLRLIDEIDANIGEKVSISKDNISSMKINRQKEKTNINVNETIKKLGLEDTQEVRNTIENLMEKGIPINRENIESFLASKEYLKEIVENLDFDTCIKLIERNIDLKEDSLQKIVRALKEIKDARKSSIKDLMKLTRKLTYKEAQSIAEDIYNRKMGKDVYDAIIALHKEKIPVNKENIERVLEVINKLYDLKDCNDEVFVKVLVEEVPVNIETLYKFKYSYKNGKMDENITGSLYEQFTVVKEPSIEDILNILEDFNIVNSQENIQLAREFLLAGVKINGDDFEKIKAMKRDLKELIAIANKDNMARIIKEGVDPLKEDITALVKRIKDINSNGDTDSSDIDNILKDLENLNSITDRELLELIRSGEDFKIENLKKIVETGVSTNGSFENNTIEKAITLSNIFNTLGNLSSETIALASKRYEYISLNNLYSCHMDLSNGVEQRVTAISQIQENLIRQEYLNIRNNTTINLIKESIKDKVSIENMPLDQLNEYIDKKVLKYRETQKFLSEISHLRGRESSLIPVVMKNGLNMSIKELVNINSMFNGGKGIGDVFNNLAKEKDGYEEDLREGISVLEDKIKEFTKSLKERKDQVQKEYKEVLQAFEELANSFDSNKEEHDSHREDIREYMKLQNSISKNDLILQLPVSLGSGYGNVNLIIPNISKGIDENNMTFYLSLNTDKLGQTKFNLKVKDKKVYVEFNTDNYQKILDNKDILENGLDRLGYSLEKIELADIR